MLQISVHLLVKKKLSLKKQIRKCKFILKFADMFKRKSTITACIILLSLLMLLMIALQTKIAIDNYNDTTDIVENQINDAIHSALLTLQKQEVVIYVYDHIKSQNSKSNIANSANNDSFSSPTKKNSIEKNFPEGTADCIYTYDAGDDFDNVEAFIYDQFSDGKSHFNQIAMQIEAEFSRHRMPIEKRFDAKTISDVFKKTLSTAGIDMPFEFGIIDDMGQSIKLASDNFDINYNEKDCYKYNMMPGNILESPNTFVIYFPNKKDLIWKDIYAESATSTLIAILFILFFAIAMYTIVRQKKLDTIKSDFINNMTHEFKTPIATIKLAASTIKTTQNSPEISSKMVEVILQETTKMTQNVEQILMSATLDRKKLKLKLNPEKANDFVKDIASSMELTVEGKGGKLNVNTCENDVTLYIDSNLMTTVLVNLIDNATKYTKNAPIIDITTYTKGDRYFISVKDNGFGISKEAQSKIFDKFYRESTGNTHNIKGFGLGLNFAREIVIAHKGLISVSSVLGEGSEFNISLPILKN